MQGNNSTIMELTATLAQNLKSARQARGWTLEAFAEASGVSRAMISKIERGEVSPTAVTLGRLAAGLGVSLASLFGAASRAAGPLSRAADQPVWTDPATAYVRRNLSPPGLSTEIVEVSFPPGASVTFDNPWRGRALEQQVTVLEGELEMSTGDGVFQLAAGDCLHMRLDRPTGFRNSTLRPVRYLVVIHPAA